jgi:hypothetical protein
MLRIEGVRGSNPLSSTEFRKYVRVSSDYAVSAVRAMTTSVVWIVVWVAMQARSDSSRSSGRCRSVIRGFDRAAELRCPAPRLDHQALRLLLQPLGPAERPQPA